MPKSLIPILLAALLVWAPRSEAATLKIATIAPEGTAWMTEMRAGAEEIEKRTAERVTFKFYPGGVMGNDRSVMRKIRIGQLQGGALTGGELAKIYPDIQLYSLPLLFSSYDEVDYVRTRMDRVLADGLEKEGFVSLGLSEGGFVYIMSGKALGSIDDLKGHKVWIPEGDMIGQAVFDIVGVSPVSLALADVYTGLQTGLIDTVGSSPMATIAFQWHTRLSHLTDVPLVYLVGSLVVDKKTFDKIAPADRVVVREVMGAVFRRLDKINRQDNEQAKAALKAQGMQFVSPNAEEIQRWHAVAAEALEHLLAEHAYSKELFGLLESHLQAYRKVSGAP